MGTVATATLAANNDTCGPLEVLPGQTGDFDIVITGTITVTLQRKVFGGSTFITCKLPDGVTNAAWTASTTQSIAAPGVYQLLASGVSGGSAVCRMLGNVVVNGRSS